MRSGEVLDLVGESGSGKIDPRWLVLRLIEPSPGRVCPAAMNCLQTDRTGRSEFLSGLLGHSASVDQTCAEADWIADKLDQDIDRISDLTDLQAEPLDDPPVA